MKKIFEERNYENVNKYLCQGRGRYGIPYIEAEDYTECEWIGFNYAASRKKGRDNVGVHFYLDDYQFQRLWNMPDYYLPMLRQFKYVLSPDFSIYADFPFAVQLYNHYRKHWLAAYMQMHGIQVIPSIAWSDESSYEWCFEGEPVRGTVSVSSVGTQDNERSKQLFLNGYQEMLRRLSPEKILFWGVVPQECDGNIIQFSTFQQKFREVIS